MRNGNIAKNRLVRFIRKRALSGTFTDQKRKRISFQFHPGSGLARSGLESARLLARTMSAGLRRLRRHPAVRRDATTGGVNKWFTWRGGDDEVGIVAIGEPY
jgi:hypothetical protein